MSEIDGAILFGILWGLVLGAGSTYCLLSPTGFNARRIYRRGLAAGLAQAHLPDYLQDLNPK